MCQVQQFAIIEIDFVNRHPFQAQSKLRKYHDNYSVITWYYSLFIQPQMSITAPCFRDGSSYHVTDRQRVGPCIRPSTEPFSCVQLEK
jgi:hypothetical protein